MIARDRGLKDLVIACEDVGAKLVVAGHGPDEAELLNHIESSHAASYLGTISYDEVLERTAACQVVAALYDPRVPNNRFAAPNKLFEAMMFAKPVLVSEGTLAADIVREVGCGLVVRYGDREALKKAPESVRWTSTRSGANRSPAASRPSTKKESRPRCRRSCVRSGSRSWRGWRRRLVRRPSYSSALGRRPDRTAAWTTAPSARP